MNEFKLTKYAKLIIPNLGCNEKVFADSYDHLLEATDMTIEQIDKIAVELNALYRIVKIQTSLVLVVFALSVIAMIVSIF